MARHELAVEESRLGTQAIVSFSYAPLDLITALSLIIVGLSAIFAVVSIVLRITNPTLRRKA